MLTSKPRVTEALDLALIGFLTAVDREGQPQTSPVWFLRDGDELIVYNRPKSRRLASIVDNDRVAFTLRADRQATGMLTIEGRAVVDDDLEPADRVEAYVTKYAEEIEGMGWTPEQFASLYSVGIRVRVTRLRVWAIDHVIEAEK
jgi:PPOX class probable F420-dependent enzyme